MECIKCKNEMFTAKLCADTYGIGVYLINKKKGILEKEKRSSVSCYVCSKCGNIELKADNPNDINLNSNP